MTLKARAATDADWNGIAAFRNWIKDHPKFCAVDRPVVAAADLKAMLKGCFVYVVEDVPVGAKTGTIVGFVVDRAPFASVDQHVEVLYCTVDYDRPDAKQAARLLTNFSARDLMARGFKRARLGIAVQFLDSLSFMEAGIPRATEEIDGTDPTTGKVMTERIEYLLADIVKATT
jgi:hypothetical protein